MSFPLGWRSTELALEIRLIDLREAEETSLRDILPGDGRRKSSTKYYRGISTVNFHAGSREKKLLKFERSPGDDVQSSPIFFPFSPLFFLRRGGAHERCPTVTLNRASIYKFRTFPSVNFSPPRSKLTYEIVITFVKNSQLFPPTGKGCVTGFVSNQSPVSRLKFPLRGPAFLAKISR